MQKIPAPPHNCLRGRDLPKSARTQKPAEFNGILSAGLPTVTAEIPKTGGVAALARP
jgi:hypothetical protein